MITNDVIIDVQDVYKSFRVYFDKGSMLKEQFVNPGRSRYEEREILRGISFTIKRGETVALIGKNGCGKSTTLKMLTQILYPNKGTVTVRGKVSSLIELGAGFHPDMSGRENIYINASILGIKRSEVDKRIDEIIRFSELEEFIDNPIRTYSSGMYMRLAFSVAINVDADILLIDEILAVGDQAFQEKCIRKLDELRASGVTIVLVSHAMNQVKEIADRCIWLENGRIVEDGDTETVCAHYEESMTAMREHRDEMEEIARSEEKAERANETVNVAVDTDSIINTENKKALRRREAIKRRATRVIEHDRIRKLRQQSFVKRWSGGGSQGIPLVGIIGMMLMLLCHAAQDIYGIGYADMPEMSILMQIAGFTLFSVGRVGIPVFIMLLGFKLLSEDYGSRELRLAYFKNKVLPMLVTWEIWVVIYEVFLHVWDGRDIGIMVWLRHALLIDVLDYSHAWFARMFLIMMIAVPYLALFLQWMKADTLRILMILVWTFIFLFPGLDLYGQYNGADKSIPYPLGTMCYLFYLCLGYLLSLYAQRILKGSREVILLILALIITVITQILFYGSNVHYLIWYTYYGVSLMALFGFDIAVRLKLDRFGVRFAEVLESLFKCVIGVYLVHRPVQMLLDRYVFLSGVGMLGGAGGKFALRTVLLWLTSLVATLMIVWVIGLIPVVGKLIVGMKSFLGNKGGLD